MLKTLIAEDDPTSQLVMEEFLSEFGTCKVVGDGEKAVSAFKEAMDASEPYELVCLDIMVPVMDGQAALKAIREYEAAHGVAGHHGVKVIMTTALSDSKNVLTAFQEQCEAYIVKPVSQGELVEKLRDLGLLKV